MLTAVWRGFPEVDREEIRDGFVRLQFVILYVFHVAFVSPQVAGIIPQIWIKLWVFSVCMCISGSDSELRKS